MFGSSPRVRGTVNPDIPRLDDVRFIPACAGNRLTTRLMVCRKPVHPRVCGEQSGSVRTLTVVDGSSPRVRGTVPLRIRPLVPFRFIPACAGNRLRRIRETGRMTVHPRVCGEQSGPAPVPATWYGSSPRVRGTVSCIVCIFPTFRFIPACAGNSTIQRRQATDPAVHPRVCGEQQCAAIMRSRAVGSSPRVRGTVHDEPGWSPAVRFIPACAGNRSGRFPRTRPAPVHPRVCGEQVSRTHQPGLPGGSSPRVRGTVTSVTESVLERRFIPACAGNSRPARVRQGRRPVHPRVCGEQ